LFLLGLIVLTKTRGGRVGVTGLAAIRRDKVMLERKALAERWKLRQLIGD
jgi:hypothetical protein